LLFFNGVGTLNDDWAFLIEKIILEAFPAVTINRQRVAARVGSVNGYVSVGGYGPISCQTYVEPDVVEGLIASPYCAGFQNGTNRMHGTDLGTSGVKVRKFTFRYTFIIN